jgi:hypothetical protein
MMMIAMHAPEKANQATLELTTPRRRRSVARAVASTGNPLLARGMR